MSQKIYSENLQLSLDTFTQRMYLLNKADRPKLIAKIVLQWTKAQPLLTKKLLQYLLHLDKKIIAGEESRVIEKVIFNKLLKEFKHDDLTLKIRKTLYQRNLENILEENNYRIDANIDIYLCNLQKKLGLSDRECQSIKYEYPIYRRGNSKANYNKTNHPNSNHRQPLLADSNLVNSDFTADTDYVPHFDKESFVDLDPQTTNDKTFSKAWLGLLLIIPLLFIAIKKLPPLTNSARDVGKYADLQQQKLCVDLGTRRSPRMSLGEKLLTKDYSHLSAYSSTALYEGANAFGRCEFSAAEQKYQKTLALDKNNPEALIYYNNSRAIASEHFKIAVSVPLGNKPDIAWEILRGVAQAQSQINQQGGIKNKQLLIQVADDDNDPYIVKQIAKQLAADNKVLAVIGHNDSNSSLTAANIYQENKLVAISPTSTSTKLSGVGSYILRTIPSVSVLASKLADYASDKSLTKVAFCSDPTDSASNSFIQEFKFQMKENGGEIKQIGCDFSQDNYQADLMVDKAIAQGADTILVAPSVNNLDRAIALARVNQKRLPLLGNHSLYTNTTIESGQDALAGIVIPVPWLSDPQTNGDFSQATKKYWGGEVNWRTAMAYDATEAIIQGLQTSRTRFGLQSALTKPKFEVDGVTGKFHFERGDRFGKVELVKIAKSPQNSSRYEFSKLKMDNEDE